MCIKKKCTLNPVYNFNNNDTERDRLLFAKIDFEKTTAFLGNEQENNCSLSSPVYFLLMLSVFFSFLQSFYVLVTSVILHPVGNLKSISGKPIYVHHKGNT